MFHSIITILTTAAVAFHAMLGCCAHHAHSCDSHESGLAVVASAEAKGDCSHGEHDHDHESGSPSEELAGDCDHEDDDRHHDDCGEGDCSFTSVPRSNDLELMLTFSMWCQALSDTAHANAFDGLLSLHAAAETSPDPLMDSGTVRAISQVWRL